MKTVLLSLLLLISAGAIAQHPEKNLPAVKPIDRQGLRDLIRADSGSIVVVNTWASWCKPCQEEMPALVRLAARYRKQNVVLILVAIDDIDILQKTIRPMLARFGVTFPSYILQGTADDEFITSMNAAWSGALPATFLYDRTGKQTSMLVGGKSYRQFAAAVGRLAGAKSPGVKPVP